MNQLYASRKARDRRSISTSESTIKPSNKKQNRPLKFGLRTHADFTRELQTIESSDNVISSSNSMLSSIPVPSSSFVGKSTNTSNLKEDTTTTTTITFLGNHNVHPSLVDKFNSGKQSLDTALAELKERANWGKSNDNLDEDDVAVRNDIINRLVDDLRSLYPKLRGNLAQLCNPEEDYSEEDDVVYACGYDDNGKPKLGDTSNKKTRQKFLKKSGSKHTHFAVIGTSQELVEKGFVNMETVNYIYERQLVGAGFDKGPRAERLAKEKIIRQVAEALLTVCYECKDGPIAESILALRSERLQQLVKGLLMFNTMSGEDGEELVQHIKEYLTLGLSSVINLDTWPKADDVLRKIKELYALVHPKHERGGVNPYLDQLLTDPEFYRGFFDCNECPYTGVMKRIHDEITTIMASNNDSSRTKLNRISRLLASEPNTDKPYFEPSKDEYARGMIKKLESLNDQDSTFTLYTARFSSIDNIRKDYIKELMVIPGSKVECSDGTSIESRGMKLVLYRGKFLILVRGSSFRMFTPDEKLKSALQYCLEFVDEAVVKYCLGVLNAKGLDHILKMMQSYAMLIAGPSGSVSDPKGSIYHATYYILPKGVFGALEGQAGNKMAGAKSITDVFGGSDVLHYYGVLYLLILSVEDKKKKAPKPKQFNKLLNKMGSGLSVKVKEGCYIFKDENGEYFYNQFDMIHAEGDVELACKCLIELTPEMVQYLVGVEIELDEQAVEKMTKCINNYIGNLYGECEKTNSIKKSMKTRINMLVEALYERQRSDLVDLVYHLPRYDYLMIFLQWWDDIIKLTVKKKYWFPINDNANTSVFILPNNDKHRQMYKTGKTIRHLDDNDWRKKIVISKLNWHKYNEGQRAKADKGGDDMKKNKKGKVNKGALEDSNNYSASGNDNQAGMGGDMYDDVDFGSL